ncbi:alpha/beta-hydrolase [Hyaloscypha bicolor E]|uniref:Carboxylic ester hydrolase n=1 Tax=Hyaloscypha bicolor E TaxID=1095630 RepID=A0A2J6T6Z2_9HELO|nr:alpha/beta-hydrolase [Hyaloscypha bicolor E]PMD58787.1 alpha/beta-hydrolase [Hyaloscypha bicolor E]
MIRCFALVLSVVSITLAVPLQVDLGYSIYQGVANSTTGLTTFKGIRYAAPPLGSLRWQAPLRPAVNRTAVISAADFGPACPNSPLSLGVLGTFGAIPGDEDCLNLNVYAPTTAPGTRLPVLVYIHGGGYGAGDGKQDMTSIINTNGNSFIAVTIQYRLGAFGFLSSAIVKANGVLNAGILDQNFALQWVQNHISCFGGDPTRVTISGESSGGGSVMLHDLAYGGTLGNSLFINSISASPYLPMQWGYADSVPTNFFIAFATAAGCPTSAKTTMICLRSKNSTVLQNASFAVSGSGEYGTWAFPPVTDGTYIQQRPSQALLQKKVNGKRHLSGNCANEGNLFHQPIASLSDFNAWVNLTFPLFTADDKAALATYYPITVSYQETASEIFAETTIVCPSYWLAEAYSPSPLTGYKFQYSVPVALHSTDLPAYFGPPTPNQGPDFVKAFQTIWGNFVTLNNPSISNTIANGASAPNPSAPNAASAWPAYTRNNPAMINLNETGGTLTNASSFGLTVLEYFEPGLLNNITLVNAATWENGRGARCDWWRGISADVPEKM